MRFAALSCSWSSFSVNWTCPCENTGPAGRNSAPSGGPPTSIGTPCPRLSLWNTQTLFCLQFPSFVCPNPIFSLFCYPRVISPRTSTSAAQHEKKTPGMYHCYHQNAPKKNSYMCLYVLISSVIWNLVKYEVSFLHTQHISSRDSTGRTLSWGWFDPNHIQQLFKGSCLLWKTRRPFKTANLQSQLEDRALTHTAPCHSPAHTVQVQSVLLFSRQSIHQEVEDEEAAVAEGLWDESGLLEHIRIHSGWLRKGKLSVRPINDLISIVVHRWITRR